MTDAASGAPAPAQFPDESEDGAFVRQDDAFRDWVRADGSTPYPPEAGRYQLYVSYACPWAHRTVIVRALMGLEDALGMTVVNPIRDEAGWRFGGAPGLEPDPIEGFTYLATAYAATDPEYDGRVTVPVLWDTQTHRIVSNSDDDIMRMLETEFGALARRDADLYPREHRAEIEQLNAWLYERFNNGVYRAGFATTQREYERAVLEVFATLDRLEARLAERRYLLGNRPLESDWRAFVTLVRFDPVYVGHFKCNLRRIVDYPNLWGYLRDLYQIPGIAATVNFDHIKRHYYMTHDEINPARIVPLGPLLDFEAPHDRARLASFDRLP
ncbi:MAG: glutathione S-transferase family protein [Vulcanimicrobiaceae bacterium]